jgi:LPS sulfotransferase NodH
MKQNQNWEYYNQPWSSYFVEGGIIPINYDKCIKKENVLIKSTPSNLLALKVTMDKVISDFHKVILISRRNKREQAISSIIASDSNSYLDTTQKKYFIDGIVSENIDKVISMLEDNDAELMEFHKLGAPLFYYEDLYYGSFTDLFKELGLEYIEEDYNEILNTNKRYKAGELVSKKNKTLI